MAKVADIEDVKYRYEVAGESIAEICSDLMIFTADLEHIVRSEGWVKAIPPGQDATEEEVNDYYKRGRMRLTTQMTRRAIKLMPKLSRIEDAVIEALDSTLQRYEPTAQDASHNLARIVNAFSKLIDKQALLHEAIATPALADKKLETLLKDVELTKLLDALDGKGRKLPSQDD